MSHRSGNAPGVMLHGDGWVEVLEHLELNQGDTISIGAGQGANLSLSVTHRRNLGSAPAKQEDNSLPNGANIYYAYSQCRACTTNRKNPRLMRVCAQDYLSSRRGCNAHSVANSFTQRPRSGIMSVGSTGVKHRAHRQRGPVQIITPRSLGPV